MLLTSLRLQGAVVEALRIIQQSIHPTACFWIWLLWEKLECRLLWRTYWWVAGPRSLVTPSVSQWGGDGHSKGRPGPILLGAGSGRELRLACSVMLAAHLDERDRREGIWLECKTVWGKKISHACEALEVTSVLDSSSPILSLSAGISSVEWHSTLQILYVESSFQLSLTALSFPLSC